MSEYDDELALRDEFARWRAETRYALPRQDIKGVRAVARRRRTRVLATGLCAGVVLAVPVAGFAAVGGGNHGKPAGPPADSARAAGAGLASPSLSSHVNSSGGGMSTVQPVPAGGIGIDELGNATLDIPTWSPDGIRCAPGRQRFTDRESGPPGPNPRTRIDEVVYADVDHDGAQETVALLSCSSQGASEQVVVFDRDSSGAIVTIGQVAAMTPTIGYIFDVRPESGGSVGVQVGNRTVCCGTQPARAERQWRVYSYDRGGFRQTGGPIAFHPVTRID